MTSALTTPLLADACMRLSLEVRTGPEGLVPLVPCPLVLGPARPVRHRGSVDAFLEAIDSSRPGDVLVVDDRGRRDRGCVGDLTALEAQAAGLLALVVWGAHRDGADLRRIGLPVFSLGSMPSGPRGLDAEDRDALVRLGDHVVTPEDAVAADEDGVLLLPAARLGEIVAAAEDISRRERRQAELVRGGASLRQQLRFADYLAARALDPSLTFRAHLRSLGGAIEE